MEKLKSFSVFNSKGGVGKSTIIAALGYELGTYGKTLIIDADPQGSISDLFLGKELQSPENKNHDLYHLFLDEENLDNCIYNVRKQDETYKGLYVIPAGDKRKFRAYISSTYKDAPEKTFKDVLSEIKTLDYDYLLVDLPGSINFYEGSILAQLDEIIPITQPEKFSNDTLQETFVDVNKYCHLLNGSCDFSKYMVINNFESDNKTHQHYIEWLDNNFSDFIQAIINHTKIASSANSQHLVMQEWQQNNKSSQMIKLLAKKIK